MVRQFYGPVTIVQPTPSATDDPTAVGYATVALFVYRARTGGAAETALQTPAGAAQTQVSPDPANGAYAWLGPDGYTGSLWIADPQGTRWEVQPAGLANRLSVSGISVNGGAVQTGDVALSTAATLNDLTDVSTVGGATGHVLTRLADGTYGLAAPAASGGGAVVVDNGDGTVTITAGTSGTVVDNGDGTVTIT